jgi:Protein of unknown function (DUF3168)
MSIQTEIVTALSAVASGRVYPQVAPADAALPFVVYRVVSQNPLELMSGYSGSTQYTVVFESYATTYQGALTLSASVISAIEAATTLISYRDSSSGEEYEPSVDVFMEPVYFGFWHTA